MIFALPKSIHNSKLGADDFSYLDSSKELGKDFLALRLPDRLHNLWDILLNKGLQFGLWEKNTDEQRLG